MRLISIGVAALSPLLFFGCVSKSGQDSARASASVQSAFSDLSGVSCNEQVDHLDPNDTPYLNCPGAAGYSLLVRKVDSGRQSIDVLDAAGHAHPLNLQETVTRHMANLHGQAEWRLATKDGRQTPIALIVRVQAREDDENPEKVTHTYLAVAKITQDTACVTDRLEEGAQSQSQVYAEADSARQRRCAPPQPPIEPGGTAVR